MKLKKFIRASMWWNHIVAMLCGVLLVDVWSMHLSGLNALYFFCSGLIALIGIAGFGYSLNNVTDEEEDIISGKLTSGHKLSSPTKYSIVFGFLLIGIFAFSFMPNTNWSWVLFIFQVSILTLYSVPPFRLKENPIAGVIIDSLYSTTVPTLIFLAMLPTVDELTILAVILITFMKGCRSILVHQIDDRKQDFKLPYDTFVIRYGLSFSWKLIHRLFIPVELTGLFYLSIKYSDQSHVFFAGLVIFLIYTIIRFRIWKVFSIPKYHWTKKFLYFMNDFYEEWFPVIMLIALVQNDIRYMVVLLLFILLFPNGIRKLVKG